MSKPNKRKWLLIRENFVFQIKLMLDAVRDLLLSPVAIICTVLDLIKGNHVGNGYFQRLMNLGHQSDHWLNLFGDLPEGLDTNQANVVAAEQNKQAGNVNNKTSGEVDKNVDNLFLKVEALLVEQHQNGELTIAAKHKLNHYFEKILSRNKTSTDNDDMQPADTSTNDLETSATTTNFIDDKHQ